MARRNPAQLQFDALSLEGALLPPEWLARVAALEAPAQSPADYGVPKGLQLRDEIGRYWRIAEAIWAEFAAARSGADPVGASSRLTRDLLVQVFGFSDLVVVGERTIGGRVFPLAFEALGGRVPVVVGSPSEGMDQNVLRHGDGARRRSAWGGLQEYLNAADGALWGIATNGNTLRVGRDNTSMTRPAWLETDLERIFTEKRFADFSVLWLLLHASRFGRADQPVHEAPLETWREAGREEGSRAREALRVGVEDALRALGQGFVAHAANTELRDALASGALSPGEYFNELLRLVYRMIFLLTVEERGILHPEAPKDEEARRRHDEAVRLYADGYGMRRLRERSVRHAAHDRHADLWASIRPVFAVLARADGERTLALPGLGGLFAADQCSHLDVSALENRSLLTAVFRLAWLREGDALARVNWKDMGVEEFGSVYESLLELVPVVSDGGRRFGFAGEGESAGNARKLTGSYYTPDVLVQQLLDTALEPVVAQRLAEHPSTADAEKAVLSLAVLDPACGSGHFLLAAARRLAGHLARLRAGGTPGAAEYRHALRDVVTHCIHGVDRNPMALELARMALWLEAYTPDRALGFLDHHLVCGDALLGLLDLGAVEGGIPDEAFRALTGDDKDVAKVLTKLNAAGRKALEKRLTSGQIALGLGAQSLAEAFAQLDELKDDSVSGVETKKARFARLQSDSEMNPLVQAADHFIAAFLQPKRLRDGEHRLTEQQAIGRFPTTATIGMALDGTLPLSHPVAEVVREICRDARVLHWPTAFPQVFERGGFDVVLGNPPWEVSQLIEEEFFAVRDPEISRLSGNLRKKAIQGLRLGNSRLWSEFVEQKHLVEATNNSYRANPRYELTAFGKLNAYALFAETAYRLVASSGRVGLIIQSGLATDDSTKRFFGLLVNSAAIVSLFEFENEGFFPGAGQGHMLRFALLTLVGRDHREEHPRYLFQGKHVDDLADPERVFTQSPADLWLISPNSGACAIFQSRLDAEMTRGIYRRVPILLEEGEDGTPLRNPWSLHMTSMFNMASDSHLFRRDNSLGPSQSQPQNNDRRHPQLARLYEAKMVQLYNHRHGDFADARGGKRPHVLPASPTSRLRDPFYLTSPYYWIDAEEVEARLGRIGWRASWLMGWRDITDARASERTVIASVFPREAAGDTLLLMFPRVEQRSLVAALLADQSSLVHDYVARQKVSGLHLKYHTKKQLPTLAPDCYSTIDLDFIVPRVLELTYTAHDMQGWALDLDFEGPPFVWDEDRRARLRADLDAYYARLYGLDRDQLRFVLDPTDVAGPRYPSATFRVLKQREERQYGEYRTRRLVLEAWDRLFGS